MFTRDRICSDPFGTHYGTDPLCLLGIGYIQIRLGSTMVRIHCVYIGSDIFRSVWDPLWYGSTVSTRDRFEYGTVQFHMGSPS